MDFFDGLNTPVTLELFVKQCVFYLVSGIAIAGLMQLGAYAYFKIFKNKKKA